LPSFQGLFLTLCSVNLLGQRQKPSWCLAVRIIRVTPAALAARTHCRQSSWVGLNSFSSSLPSPHSRSVNVFIPKWTKAETSSRCHAICRGVGRTSTALDSTDSNESSGERRIVCATAEVTPSDNIIVNPSLQKGGRIKTVSSDADAPRRPHRSGDQGT
jgi:hypothetical protein